jgi:hypothetical protein
MSDLDLESEYNNFDWNSYVSYYQDLKNDNIDTKQKAWSHWKNHGKNEKRLYFFSNEKASKTIESVDANFDWVMYTTYYQDLKDDNIDTKENAWTHWVRYGKKEGRIYFNTSDSTTEFSNNAEYINFDWVMYSQYYSDLQDKKNKQVAWEHWNKYGKNENRIYFDLNNSSRHKEFDCKGTNISKTSIKPKILHPPIKKIIQANSPTDEWYDSPFITHEQQVQPKEAIEMKPIIKIRLLEEPNNQEYVDIKFDKF